MKPDVKKYLAMIEDWDMPKEQKIAFIHDLWHIMENFADRAFGIHPVQQTGNKISQANGQDSPEGLSSSNPIETEPPPTQGVRT
ncbi:MAG: hypothetical protein KUG81_03940 [Gammaproteobacteria bacterium]|nr:hypothetical protein [Gammaproteobacteria bacterium]